MALSQSGQSPKMAQMSKASASRPTSLQPCLRVRPAGSVRLMRSTGGGRRDAGGLVELTCFHDRHDAGTMCLSLAASNASKASSLAKEAW